MWIEKFAEKLKTESEANRTEPIKTSDIPQDFTPIDKAKVLLSKADSKYINHMSKRLLTSLDEIVQVNVTEDIIIPIF